MIFLPNQAMPTFMQSIVQLCNRIGSLSWKGVLVKDAFYIRTMQMRYKALMCTMQPAVMQTKHYEAVMQAAGRLGLISCCQIVEVVATDY